jgi:hypothetical protein
LQNGQDCTLFARGTRQNKGSKKEIQQAAKEGPLHMKLDQPNPCGAGGSTDTVNVARAFYKFENVEHVLNLVEVTEVEEDALRTLHRNFSVIHSVVSSKTRQVDIDSFNTFCLETYLKIVEKLTWVSISNTVHKLLGQPAEKIKMNGGVGLGTCTEEGLECSQKLSRRFR